MEYLATLCCALFTGAALYINLVEHPARMSCGARAALNEWIPSYKKATNLQASLAIAGGVFSLLAWIGGAGFWVLVAGLLLGSVVPFTLKIVMPVNEKLLELDTEQADEQEIEQLLEEWNELHMIRTGLALLALLILL